MSDNESNSHALRCGALRRMTSSYVIGRPIWGVRPDESAKATVTVSMMESTKVRSRDRACAKRSMARSFVAFGAGGHVAAPRVFPLPP